MGGLNVIPVLLIGSLGLVTLALSPVYRKVSAGTTVPLGSCRQKGYFGCVESDFSGGKRLAWIPCQDRQTYDEKDHPPAYNFCFITFCCSQVPHYVFLEDIPAQLGELRLWLSVRAYNQWGILRWKSECSFSLNSTSLSLA